MQVKKITKKRKIFLQNLEFYRRGEIQIFPERWIDHALKGKFGDEITERGRQEVYAVSTGKALVQMT